MITKPFAFDLLTAKVREMIASEQTVLRHQAGDCRL